MTSISIPVGENIDEADRPIGLDGDHRDIHGGTVLSFHNLSFFTNQYSGCPPRKKKNNILDNVSGIFRPGLNAILGPTGSGKTSLLDCLAGRIATRQLEGDILINGNPQPGDFKVMSGYVIQNDIALGMLTVRENVNFSASLRMSHATNHKQRELTVQKILEELDLQSCANCKIGTELKRGVSGGEKKRTCIAMELVCNPLVLFLDEPTTGLDSHTAFSVIRVLKTLSDRGRTVVFSVHQPRYAIFEKFNCLFLMSNGKTVYHGLASESINFFKQAGYTCDAYNNPADFFLDIIHQGNTTHFPNTEPIELIDHNSSHQLAAVFQTSRWQQELESELCGIKHKWKRTAQKTHVKYHATSCLSQLKNVCGRSLKCHIRSAHTLVAQVVSSIILGLIVGSIYFQVDESYTSGIQNRVGAFFFIAMNHVFGNMAAVDLFIKERHIFRHETDSGYYGVSTYFLAKVFCDIIPTRLLSIITFSAVSYWMIGLRNDAMNFVFYTVNLFLTSMAGVSVALLFSATCNVHTIGTIFTALTWVVMMVFSGLLVNVNTIPVWLRWLKWTSIFRYSMNGFVVNELKNNSFCDYINETAVPECDTGNAYMTRQGIPHESMWDICVNPFALIITSFVFLLVAYIQLCRTRRK